MATQLLPLPAPAFEILRKLARQPGFATALEAEGLLVPFADPFGGHKAPERLGILLNPEVFCPELRQAPGQWLYGLCAYTDPIPQRRFHPMTLPEEVVTRAIAALIAAIETLPEASAHEVLTLVDALTNPAPREAELISKPMSSPSAAQLEVLATARSLERALGPRLVALDERRRAYDAVAGRHGLAYIVHAISHLAPVARRALRQQRLGPVELKLLQQSRLVCSASSTTHAIVKPGQPGALIPIDVGFLGDSHLDCARNSLPSELWARRRDVMPPSSVARLLASVPQHDDSQGGIAPEGVAAALAQHCSHFDWPFWEEIHPVLRAAMGFTDFMRIRPFVAGNRMLAELLFEFRLWEGGFSLFPVAAPLFWHRKKLTRALALDDPETRMNLTVELLVERCIEACELGTRLALTIADLRKDFFRALFPNAPANRAERDLVDVALTLGVVRAGDLVENTQQWPGLAGLLQPALRQGLLRHVGTNDHPVWLVANLLAPIQGPATSA